MPSSGRHRCPALDMSRTQPAAQPLEEMERWTIVQAVNKVGVLKAPRLLGIGQATAYRKLKPTRYSSREGNRVTKLSKLLVGTVTSCRADKSLICGKNISVTC